MSNLNEYIKKAFEYKNKFEYKEAIDYFYKALALDNESCEIMAELADLYSKLSQYERASNFYEQIIIKHPDNYKIKFDYALALKKNNELVKAETILDELFFLKYDYFNTAYEFFDILLLNNKPDKVISLASSDKKLLENSKICIKTAKAFSLIGDSSKAMQLFNIAFDIDNTNIEAGYNVACSLFDKGSIDDAFDLTQKLLNFSENDKLFYLLAEIYYVKNNIDSAINYYSCAIKMNPKISIYYFKLGLAFSLKGYFNEAEKSYQKAISLDINNPSYNYALAYLYYTAKKYKESEIIIENIISFSPENIKALSLYAILLIKKNESAKASKIIEKINKLPNQDDFSFYARAIFYSELKLWDKAVYFIKSAIELNNDSIEYKFTLAQLLFYSADYSSAENICNEIIDLNNKYIQALILKAKIYFEKSDYINAIKFLDEAKSLDINSHEIYYLYALIDFKTDKLQSAAQNLKIALSICPSEEKYYAFIAKIFYNLKNYSDSFLYYKEAAALNITNADYRYFMALCSMKLNDNENTLANFSIMKRLAPSNINYIEAYALYYAHIGNKKAALDILKTLNKNISSQEDKAYLKHLVEKIKKYC